MENKTLPGNAIEQMKYGWYYYELNRERMHGPYMSREDAEHDFKHYCETFLLERAE